MALGYLFILFVVLFVLSFLSVMLLLIAKRPKVTRLIVFMTTLFSLFLTVINVTSWPSNYYIEQVIGYIFGGFAIVGFILYYRKRIGLAKAFISFSITASIIQLFFF